MGYKLLHLDWDVVRREWDSGTTARAISVRYGCSESAILSKVSRSGWHRSRAMQCVTMRCQDCCNTYRRALDRSVVACPHCKRAVA